MIGSASQNQHDNNNIYLRATMVSTIKTGIFFEELEKFNLDVFNNYLLTTGWTKVNESFLIKEDFSHSDIRFEVYSKKEALLKVPKFPRSNLSFFDFLNKTLLDLISIEGIRISIQLSCDFSSFDCKYKGVISAKELEALLEQNTIYHSLKDS